MQVCYARDMWQTNVLPIQTRLVEDITIRVTRPGGAGLRHNDHHVKPSTKLEDGGSVMGLRPGDGLRPVVITAVRVKLVV